MHRSADEREPWNPAESVTPAEALAASTDGQPTSASKARGDLIPLDADPPRAGPVSVEADRILRGMPVAATLVGGRVTQPWAQGVAGRRPTGTLGSGVPLPVA